MGHELSEARQRGALAGDGKSEWLPVYQAWRDSPGLIGDQVLAGSKASSAASVTFVGVGLPREYA